MRPQEFGRNVPAKTLKHAQPWQRFTIVIRETGFSGLCEDDTFVRSHEICRSKYNYLPLGDQNRKSLPYLNDFSISFVDRARSTALPLTAARPISIRRTVQCFQRGQCGQVLQFRHAIRKTMQRSAMNIVVLDAYVNNPGDLSWEPLKQFGTVTLYDRTSADKVATRAADADIAVTNKVAWDAAALDACPNLKGFQRCRPRSGTEARRDRMQRARLFHARRCPNDVRAVARIVLARGRSFP